MEFYALLIASSVVAVISLRNLLVQRFPHPADLAIVSTYYYAVPLAICGYFSFNPQAIVFLHSYAADPGLASQSLRFAFLAICAIQIGRWAATKTGDGDLRYYFPIGSGSALRASAGYAFLLGLVAFGIVLFGWQAFVSGYATESNSLTANVGIALVYFATGTSGLAFAYTLLIRMKAGDRTIPWAMLLLILAVIFVLIARSKRLEIVSAMIPAAIVMFSQRKSLKVTTKRIVAGLFAVTILIAVSIYRVDAGDDISLFNVAFYGLSEGLYAGHSLPGILGNLETRMLGFENGGRFLNALLGFIPSFLWEGKNDMVYAGNIALESVSPLGATNILAEIVLQGGLIAVAVVYTIMGYLFQRVMLFERHWDDDRNTGLIPLRFGFYLVTIAIFVPHFRDGIIPSVKLSLQGMVFLLALVSIKSILRKAETPFEPKPTPGTSAIFFK
jgi:oligosaccharide repeat unit polymerase